MSTSQHPIALELERRVGGATKLLATVMFLPLLDGIFPALVLAGALDTTAGILQVGLLVFGGSATVAVILAEMDGTPRSQAKTVLLVGIPLIIVAGIEAALAPSIAELVDLVIFERFAALVILAIAAKTASATIGEYMPRPAVIVGLGLFASLDPSGAELVFVSDPELVARGVAAAGVGVGFALLVALFGPMLRSMVDLDRFRFGSAVALGLLPLSLLDLPLGDLAPLAVLVLTAVFALDPNASNTLGDAPTTKSDSGATGQAHVTDGGPEPVWDADEESEDGSASERREPWL
ncbi:DUF5794 domain-containing protein [Natranaeroarchaeum sulfidigenes]|uniref:Putative membrane protein n=1 Tax=Natranaeroarchaeum sulfidigenes TaxID=2784880 RepID=A0A897MUB0_9EURY|nr:DUF5794 domain-containing protein [Natranaeroarchaeum sulfidigenes]QSG02539.1 putative membrane protein [Natranaeroarchaeum sulfidigenes]